MVVAHQMRLAPNILALNALEMAMGVFAAGLGRGRVELPLKNRQHLLKAREASRAIFGSEEFASGTS